MAQTSHPRRSALYMPGSNARALEKARSLPADVLILDLEDATAPDAKEEARSQVIEAVDAGGYGQREVVIRVNGLDTEWGHADLKAAARSGADAILLPKVESADMVRQAAEIAEANGLKSHVRLWCMMETPMGILQAKEIAGASPRLGGLVMGTSDLAKEMHASHTAMRLPMLSSLSTVLLAARAFDLACLDGVFLDLNDDAGYRASCIQGLELGFDGKTLIHPRQLDVANEIFAPSEAALKEAGDIIAAHAEAAARGEGVVLLNGKLIENLHVENARRLVKMAEEIEDMST